MSALSPVRQKWTRLLQGIILEFAKDGFKECPKEAVDALQPLMRYAAKNIERVEREEAFKARLGDFRTPLPRSRALVALAMARKGGK